MGFRWMRIALSNRKRVSNLKKIILSVGLILLVIGVVAGATYAIFSDQAIQNDNTFATGTLEIRLNGQESLGGFTFSNAAPGDCKTGQFGVNNFGAPWFAGPSTLAAKELVISSLYQSGDTPLFNALTAKIEANRGWPTRMLVYDGALSGLSEGDLLDGRWTDLAAGNSEDVYYEICLPLSADNTLMGKSTTFDFLVDAYNPVRP